MTQKRVRRRSQSSSRSERSDSRPERSGSSRSSFPRSEHAESQTARQPSAQKRASTTQLRERHNHAWAEPSASELSNSSQNWLTDLIQQDAPLRNNSTLVLMYGPFQAEMGSATNQGVASWLRDCVRKHGIPSLVRFDYRHRAQVYRRDQFQPWLEPLLNQLPSQEVS
jgi:hypothetical protein